MSKYREFLENWLKTIDVKADAVIDIGGSAKPVKSRVKSWDVNRYFILDDDTEKEFCDRWEVPDLIWNINYKRQHKNVDDLIGRFNVAFMLEVAEYLFDPITACKNIHDFLTGDGIFYSSWPAIYPVHNPREFDYLRYTRNGIERILEEAGFQEIEFQSRFATAGREALSIFYSQEGMHPVKDDIIFDIGYLVKCKR